MAGALPVTLALALATQFAPVGVPADTLLVIAQGESGMRPLAIHDNTTDRSYDPETEHEAVAIARHLIVDRGHSVDLGIMQVTSANLAPHGLSITDALRPGPSMRVGGTILASACSACGCASGLSGERQAHALRCALSHYNTGKDGAVGRRYAARVWTVAERFVPSIGKLIADFPSAAPGTDEKPVTRLPTTAVTTRRTRPALPVGSGLIQLELSSNEQTPEIGK